MVPRFRFITETTVVHSIPVGTTDDVVQVVGEPENGVYEWVINDQDNDTRRFSDVGYGSPAVALRDGLIAALGLPA